MNTVTVEELKKVYNLFVQRASQYPEHADAILSFCNKYIVAEMKCAPSQTVAENTYKPEPVRLEEKPSLEVKRKVISLEKSPWRSGKSKITRNRIGNGHKVLKKRKLLEWEKNYIRAEFIKLNGIIHEDFTLPIKAKLGDEVSIFQVTGFVTLLHKYVAEGSLVLPDMNRYWSHKNSLEKAA